MPPLLFSLQLVESKMSKEDKVEAAASHGVSMTVPWQESKLDDDDDAFDELHKAMAENRTKKFSAAGTGDQSSGSSDEDDDEEEPPEDEPGQRLLWAAQFGRLDVAESILAADPGLVGHRDDDGYSALHRAAYSGHESACRLLLSMGADPAATTKEGWTPLHSACHWGRAGCAEVLLADAATPVNATTRGGQTPLHLAAACGGRDASGALQVLLTCGRRLEVGARNEQGDTAADLAGRFGGCGGYLEELVQDYCFKISDN